ncbi:methionyl-tRNA formyltransferase [Haloarcula hispanica]|uniref:Methionyl-tRNA formyltransferase n=1 Tax=Haloarcula hispanica TaxID=51589 RepID=A0A482TBB1_HALHI|nr:methionyl-tRNA formyltransferase [Haloarcula hispanica]MCJ0619392.1 methionyl-tRNA formyltransferase [Haloarcula hispanica]RYJ09885.1 methionyl-tRNA formyltransferase [Haloarcula hispanica]
MRVTFVTHNELGLACLNELVELGADIRAVFTRTKNEDISDQTDLSAFCEREDITLHNIRSVNNKEVKKEISSYNPELLFVVGWSQLVDAEVLSIPTVTALGMHPAPLPRGRGRAPIAWSLIKGLDQTALSLFHLVEEADAGDLVGQEPIKITNDDDAAALYNKVVEAGKVLIRDYYPAFESGMVPRTPQDESQATWWPKRKPCHGLINWNDSPREVYDWIRGQSDPYPGAFSYINGRKVTIWSAQPPTNENVLARPGEIVYIDGDMIGVGAWEGIVELSEVQPDGDKRIPAARLVTDYQHEVGDSFEAARARMR